MRPIIVAAEWAPYAKASAYFVVTVVVARLLDWVLSRRGIVEARLLGRSPTVAETSRFRVTRRLAVAVVLFIGIALALVQIPIVGSLAKGMIASAGITALVVGLASRSIIANFASGLTIAFSQPIRHGDIISIDDVSGTVEEVQLAYTYVRTSDNRRILIPNELLTSRVIHNYTLVDPVSSASFELEVPPTAPLAEVFGVALDELRRLGEAPPGRSPSVEVVSVTVTALRLRATVWGADMTAAAAIAAAALPAVLARLQTDGLLTASLETTAS